MNDGPLRVVGVEDDVDEEVARAHLGPFVAGAQRYLDGALAKRCTQPVLMLKLPRRRLWIPVAAVAAVAAAVAIAVLGPRATTPTQPDAPAQAAHSEQPTPTEGKASVLTPKAAPVAATERALSDLDAEAQRQWRAGNLDGAAKTFRKMTSMTGDHRYIELAYGDLVTLADQRGTPSEVVSLWTAYLERFPRGRFATNARAQVCGHLGAPDVCKRR